MVRPFQWCMGVWLVFAGSLALAQEPLLRFQHIPPEQSFSSRYIVDVAQDRDGFLWFASLYGGFARYDGHEFRTYRHDPNTPGGLVSNTVHSVYPDPNEDVLWVGTSNGLARLDLSTDEMTLFRHREGDPASLGHDGVYRVLRDSRGSLWVATEAGLSRMNADGMTFQHYPLELPRDQTEAHTPPSWVWTLYEDQQGTLWVGTIGGGLLRHEPETDSFRRFLYGEDDPASLPDYNNSVRAVFEDSRGRLWVGTDIGLTVMTDRENGAFETRDYYGTSAIVEDRSGNLWIAGRPGLKLLRSGSDEFVHILHDPSDPSGLGPGTIWNLLVDRQGMLWAPGDQVSSLPPTSLAFAVYRQPGFDYGNEPAILVAEDGHAWVGSASGVYEFDPLSGEWEQHAPFPDITDTDHNRIRGAGIFQDAREGIWVASGAHISRFDPATGTFENHEFPVVPNALTQTSDGAFWLGLPFHGIARFDPAASSQEELVIHSSDPADPESLSHNFIYTIVEDAEGALWVGTHRGLNRFDRATGKARQYVSEPGNSNSLSNSTPRIGFVDSKGRLWFGTEFGLNLYHPDTDSFTRYLNGEKPGLNVITRIIEADDHSLWLGTSSGLARFDPGSGQFDNFTHVDGVPAGFIPELNLGPDGRLYALAPAGIVQIDPDRLVHDAKPPELAWAQLSVDGQATPLPPDGLELGYKDKLLSVGFAAFDYRDPSATRFEYRLQGYDETWLETDAQRRAASFTALPAGEYTLEMRAAGANGVWNEAGIGLPITVLPPPWRTWWAWLAYALLLASLVFLIVQWRTRLLRIRAGDLQIAVDDRTTRLRESEATVRRQAGELQQLLDLKDRLFTNISHEFRTPLTLMLGPIDKARETAQNPVVRKQLDMAGRNGKRVLRLVDQLLELSRLGAEEPVTRSPHPVAPVADWVVEAFRPLAQERELTLTLVNDAELWTEVPAELLERILMNLLSNAVKFTGAGGLVKLEVTPGEDADVILQVSDTGQGIPVERIGELFERFHRLDDLGDRVPGSGIGLAMVKELVEAYDGNVSLDSTPGQGTVVTVILPRHRPATGVSLRTDHPVSEALRIEVDLLRRSDTDEEQNQARDQERALVLVVEDNPDMQQYLRTLLSGEYQVELAGNGDEGLEIALRLVPDLVICDWMMPGRDGLAVAHALREDQSTSHIPIIMLTARSDDESRLKGLREQVDDYIVKPFNDTELTLRVANLLAIRDIMRTRFSGEMFAGRDPRNELSAVEQKFLDRLSGVLETHFASEQFSVVSMAAELAMSERQLQRKLKALTGEGPAHFLRLFRLQRSLRLLADGQRIGDTAYAVGFASPAHFASCFKAQYGCTPTEFQENPGQVAS